MGTVLGAKESGDVAKTPRLGATTRSVKHLILKNCGRPALCVLCELCVNPIFHAEFAENAEIVRLSMPFYGSLIQIYEMEF
jgi:hypothetical protein